MDDLLSLQDRSCGLNCIQGSLSCCERGGVVSNLSRNDGRLGLCHSSVDGSLRRSVRRVRRRRSRGRLGRRSRDSGCGGVDRGVRRCDLNNLGEREVIATVEVARSMILILQVSLECRPVDLGVGSLDVLDDLLRQLCRRAQLEDI